MNSIIKAVAESQHLRPRDLKSHDKHRAIVLARDMAIYIILQGDSHTFTEVGRAFNRSPATASYAYQKIARNMHINPSLRGRILKLERAISNSSNPTIKAAIPILPPNKKEAKN